MEEDKECWVVSPSERSLACYNAIRILLEKRFLPALKRCDKDVLKLATGKIFKVGMYSQTRIKNKFSLHWLLENFFA